MLYTSGIRGLELDRVPTFADWMVLAIGADRLFAIRTDPVLADGRLGVVVRADLPPSNWALTCLADLAAGDERLFGAGERSAGRETGQWLQETAQRIIAAVQGSPEGAAGAASVA
jgi:hypothetical protein